MTTYNKPAVLPAWAEDKVGIPADYLQPSDADIKAGWPLSAIAPSRQRFNWLINWASNAVRYFMQRGLVSYDAAETYGVGSRVNGDDGKTYVSIQAANVNHTPSASPAWWERWGYTFTELTAFLVSAKSAHGQCELTLSGGNALLMPKNGNKLMVGGVQCTIPAAGVNLAPPATTLLNYFLYATAAGGAVNGMVASATAYALDATTGVYTMAGDTTKTLVGQGRTVGSAWSLLRSWFNRGHTAAHAALQANAATSSVTFIELSTTLRNEVLLWAGEVWTLFSTGECFNTISGTGMFAGLGIDGITPQDIYAASQTAVAGISAGPLSYGVPISDLAEGYHYATLLCRTSGGVATWSGNAITINRTTLHSKVG